MKRLGNYIYVLPFKDGRFFKYGISSNDLERVKKHDKTYSVDIDNAVIYVFKSRKHIKVIESFLGLVLPFSEDHPYDGMDGYTEIRGMDFLNDCIEELNQFAERFKAKALDLKPIYDKIKSDKERVVGYRRDKSNLLEDPEEKINNMRYLLDFFSGKKVLGIVKESDEYIRFSVESNEKPDFDKMKFSYDYNHSIHDHGDLKRFSGCILISLLKEESYSEYTFHKEYLSDGGHCNYSNEKRMYQTFISSYVKNLY